MLVDPNWLHGVGLTTPIIGATGAYVFGRNEDMNRSLRRAIAQEQARRTKLLEGASTLRPDWDLKKRATGRGQIPILAVGSYAASVLPFMLQEFERAGAADYVGPIYLLELDEVYREMCLNSMPPIFRSRVVEAWCPNYAGGMLGLRVDVVLADKDLWGQDVMAKAQEWLARIQAETEPVFLLVLLSPGGSAALGYPVLKTWQGRYPRKPAYIISILDDKTQVRTRFPQVRTLYSRANLAQGYILMDNRRFKRRSDTGIGILFPGSVVATWISDQPLDFQNALAYIFPPEDPGRVATISTWAETLPVYTIPAWQKTSWWKKATLPEIVYTKSNLLEEKAIRGIKALEEHPELQSLPLDKATLGNTKLCVVSAPVVPRPDFQRSARRIDLSLEEWKQQDPDLSIQYASIAATVNLQVGEVPMVIVLLQAINGGPDAVDALALGAPVDPKFLPEVQQQRRIPGQVPQDQHVEAEGETA